MFMKAKHSKELTSYENEFEFQKEKLFKSKEKKSLILM